MRDVDSEVFLSARSATGFASKDISIALASWQFSALGARCRTDRSVTLGRKPRGRTVWKWVNWGTEEKWSEKPTTGKAKLRRKRK